MLFFLFIYIPLILIGSVVIIFFLYPSYNPTPVQNFNLYYIVLFSYLYDTVYWFFIMVIIDFIIYLLSVVYYNYGYTILNYLPHYFVCFNPYDLYMTYYLYFLRTTFILLYALLDVHIFLSYIISHINIRICVGLHLYYITLYVPYVLFSSLIYSHIYLCFL